jgi:hypothetical protein
VTITNKGNNKIIELRICIQTSYDQNVQLILKNYLPVVYGTPLMHYFAAKITWCLMLQYYVHGNAYIHVHICIVRLTTNI